jgi:hypothetical protein
MVCHPRIQILRLNARLKMLTQRLRKRRYFVYAAGANRAWTHWAGNDNDARAGKPITYREVVQRTGIEFLPGINPGD